MLHHNGTMAWSFLSELFSRNWSFITGQDEVLLEMHLTLLLALIRAVIGSHATGSIHLLLLDHLLSVNHDILARTDSWGPLLTGICCGLGSWTRLSGRNSRRMAVNPCWRCGWLLAFLPITELLLVHGCRARRTQHHHGHEHILRQVTTRSSIYELNLGLHIHSLLAGILLILWIFWLTQVIVMVNTLSRHCLSVAKWLMRSLR